MKKSISYRIFLVIVLFIVCLFAVAGILISTILPSFYRNSKLDDIEAQVSFIRTNYETLDENELIQLFDEMRIANGGDSYILDQSGTLNTSLGMKGSGNGLGMGKNHSINSKYIFTSPIYEDRSINKIGIEVYSFGVAIDEGYLLYEVSIESLDDAVGIMLEFMVYLLVGSLVFGIIIAFIISRHISKPIRKLNELAKEMKDKKVHNLVTSFKSDEIGELEASLYSMYEELLSNIQRLETELHKERSIEKMKKQFLAQATHELKTPIAVIQGYSELVLDGIYKSEDERDHFIQSIYNETESISKLINDVLDYSKMENGFFDVNKEIIEVKSWSDKLAHTYDDYIEMKNLEFRFKGLSDELQINMDCNRMEQVIKNLLSNSVEHAATFISLTIKDLNNRLYIEVENDGDSVNDEDLPFIFDSFYKKKGKRTGTGLGLAIVKQIVLLHDGDYRVENLDNGVKFIIII